MRWLLLIPWLLPPLAAAHRGHTSTLPREACDERALGEVCEFETATHELHIGTCRSMSGDLVCVRNRPIVEAGVQVGTANLTLAAVAGFSAFGALFWLILAARSRRPRHPRAGRATSA